MPIPPSSLQRLLRFEHYFSAPIQLLIILRQFRYLHIFDTFPRSNNFYLYIMPLGAQYKPVSLDVPVTQHGIS